MRSIFGEIEPSAHENSANKSSDEKEFEPIMRIYLSFDSKVAINSAFRFTDLSIEDR